MLRQMGRDAKTGRRALAAVALFGVPVLIELYRRVLAIPQRPSWPPPRDAVTSAGAQAATEARAPAPLDFAWSTAATIEPWVEGVNFFPRIFADVEAASSSVHILMFGWREGAVGTQMAELLKRKLAEGVEVRVLVDGFGSRPYAAAREMFTGLAAAGAEIAVNDFSLFERQGLFPDRQRRALRQGELGRVDHRKLYVVDGRLLWIGGAGIEDHFRNGGFHDVMARVTGDVVRQAQALFLMSFRGHGGPLPAELDPLFPEQSEPGTTPVALLQTVPGGFVSAAQALRELVDHSQRRIDVMNPYVTDADMIQRLTAAARRVAVRIVVSETSNNTQATAAFEHHYRDLLDAGARIYEYPGAVVHAKVLVADDTVVFGTVNLDAWALYRNYEIAMMARSATTASLMEQRVFEPDIAKSRPGTPPTGLRTRSKDWVWDKLSYFL